MHRRSSFALLVLSACGGGQRDVVPVTEDVKVAGATAHDTAQVASGDAGAGAGGDGDYVHLAKRRHGVVALAEARGFAPGEVERAVDRLADEMDACAADRQGEGKLVNGAARVVVRIAAAGTFDGVNVRAAPGPAVAANLLLCILAPLKAMTFPPAGVRGFAIETEWAPVALPASPPPSPSPAATP